MKELSVTVNDRKEASKSIEEAGRTAALPAYSHLSPAQQERFVDLLQQKTPVLAAGKNQEMEL